MSTTPQPPPSYTNPHDLIESIFTYHPATDQATMLHHEAVRDACKFAAHEIVNLTPTCPEQTLALRALQQAMMWANSAIAQFGPRGS